MNVAVGLARLAMKSTFLGKVGNDVLGAFLKDTLDHYGVDVTSFFGSCPYWSCHFSSIAGGLVTSVIGAMSSIPDLETVKKTFINT